MLDELHDQMRAWLAEDPGVTATEILELLKAVDPERFTDKQARTVQRAVKQWRAREARRIIIADTAAISCRYSERVGGRERCSTASGLTHRGSPTAVHKVVSRKFCKSR